MRLLKLGLLIFAIGVLLVSHIYATSNETYLKFNIISHDELKTITRIVSIDNVKADTVFAYANNDQLVKLSRLGYIIKTLPHPGSLIKPKMAFEKNAMADWDVYPTYGAYVAMMNKFASDFPDKCEIIDAGSTVMGRQILFARISDNINSEEDEPELMYSSTMHGDETTGYILLLRLIDYLLNNYGLDPEVTRLVDSCEIWINPLANPDATYFTGDSSIQFATRFNANGVDLNRNFPDPDDGSHPDSNDWQPETMAMMDIAGQQSFVLAANIHGGAEVVNYPWDTWSRLHVDDNWFIDVCREYVDSAQYYSPSGYLTELNNGITNGYAWYPITGGRQDYMNYWHGCREVLIEISGVKLLAEAELPDYWDYNKSSFLHFLENGLYGIRGIVIDSVTEEPLFAAINIIGHDSDLDSSRVFTDPDVGDYHRLIMPGNYNIIFSSSGYIPDTVYNVIVSNDSATRVNTKLVADSSYVCGDANGDDRVNLGDAIFLINYIFKGGPGPDPSEAADSNGDGSINLGDAIHLINYIFRGGSAPEC